MCHLFILLAPVCSCVIKMIIGNFRMHSIEVVTKANQLITKFYQSAKDTGKRKRGQVAIVSLSFWSLLSDRLTGCRDSS